MVEIKPCDGKNISPSPLIVSPCCTRFFLRKTLSCTLARYNPEIKPKSN